MNTIEDRVITVLRQFFAPEDITLEASLVDDLGADSLDTVEIIMAVEEEFDLEISDEAAERLTGNSGTVRSLVDYVAAHVPA